MCYMASSSLAHVEGGSWHFDSACSIHMTGNEGFLAQMKKSKAQSVSFGGGENGHVVGKGTLNMKGVPQLEDALLIDGLNVGIDL